MVRFGPAPAVVSVRLVGVLLVLLLAVPPGEAVAQSAPADTAGVPPWTGDLVGRLAATQTGFQNWTEGGANTLAFTSGIEGKASRTAFGWDQNHEMRLSFGVIKQDTLNFRKADDQIHLKSTFQYEGERLWNVLSPTLASDVRTQFAPGYNYKKNPFKDGRPLPVKVSDLFSPAIFSQALGLTLDPRPWIKQRIGLGAKQTVVVINALRPLYNVDIGDAVRFETGFEALTRVDREVVENVRYRSSVGLFATFDTPAMPDVRWENIVTMRVNAWLSVQFEHTLLYDEDLSADLQMKEQLSLGVSYTFL